MLTTTLRYLERDGIAKRHLYPAVPLRVEYTLTECGLGLLVPVKALVAWIESEWPAIEKSRQTYDENKSADKARTRHGPCNRIYLK